MNFSSNQITGKGFKTLAENSHLYPNLVKLSISHNRITDEGFQSFLFYGNNFSKL